MLSFDLCPVIVFLNVLCLPLCFWCMSLTYIIYPLACPNMQTTFSSPPLVVVSVFLVAIGCYLPKMEPATPSTTQEAIRLSGQRLSQHKSSTRACNDRTSDSMSPWPGPKLLPRIPNPGCPPLNANPTYPKACWSFVAQCSFDLDLQPFLRERVKVAYMITLLSGRAREWGTTV